MRRIAGASILLVALLMGGSALAEPPAVSGTPPQPCLDAEREAACAEEEATQAPQELASVSPMMTVFMPPPRGDSEVELGGVGRPGSRL
ncbi:MAG: hypothetical protein QNK04_21760 [Myxococcota bacterium]|nr:hypothetical protein [Myxococcota bacterium]